MGNVTFQTRSKRIGNRGLGFGDLNWDLTRAHWLRQNHLQIRNPNYSLLTLIFHSPIF